MAYRNLAYQYETSPRKLKPEYEPIKKKYPKKSTAKKTTPRYDGKIKRKTKIKVMFTIAVCFSALLVISFRYSQIDDKYAKLKVKESELAVVDKETKQLEANIESSINLTTIEKQATEMLGMQKLKGEQIIHVNLPKVEHVETSSDQVSLNDIGDNWFQRIINNIVEFFQ